MNRAELVKQVQSTIVLHDGLDTVEISPRIVDLVLKRAFEVIAFELTSLPSDGVFLTGLGRIKPVDRAARKVKTPAGKVIEVPARKGFKFYPIKALLEDLNGE